jgi:hypothetical protein
MSAFKQLEEVGDIQDSIKNMADIVLDNYKKNPKECERLLKELNEIDKDLEELEKEYTNIMESCM